MALPKKISQLPSVVTIKNADLFAIVQDDVTSNVTFAILESVISGSTASADTYVTGGVYNSGTTSIDFTGNTDFPPFSVNVSSLLAFTGNTSGDCITDLYISNLYGCSPITVNDNLQHISSSATGINSIAWGSGTTASGDWSHAEGLGNIASGQYSHAEGRETISSGKYSHAGGYGGHFGGGGPHRVISSGDTSFVHFKQTINSGIIGAYGDYSAILGGNDHNIGTGSTSSGIFAGSGNTISDNVLRSVVIGGSNITGTTNDTVYVPTLNISNLVMANNDTDAGLSGLTTGDIYQTSGNGGAPLNEVGLLMIKQ